MPSGLRRCSQVRLWGVSMVEAICSTVQEKGNPPTSAGFGAVVIGYATPSLCQRPRSQSLRSSACHSRQPTCRSVCHSHSTQARPCCHPCARSACTSRPTCSAHHPRRNAPMSERRKRFVDVFGSEPMHELAVEEQHIAGLHAHRHNGRAVRDGHRHVGEALCQCRLAPCPQTAARHGCPGTTCKQPFSSSHVFQSHPRRTARAGLCTRR